MVSNNYKYNYPYHQRSSAPQHSSYQTAPASSTAAQPSRQYQQPSSAASNQAADYLSCSGPSYRTSSTGYGAAQDSTWTGSGSSYAARDNGSRAAEVLHSMSNTGYAATIQSGLTASNSTSAQYSSGRSPQAQAQALQISHTTYGQTQPRPRSVNTKQAQASGSRGLSSPATAAGHSSQRVLPQYQQQQTQQRTSSPAQAQYSQKTTATAGRDPSMAAAGTSHQYADYGHRQLSNVETSRTSHSVPPANSYASRPPAQVVQPPVASISESYTGSSTTVDPTAVYDPWPEYQRQQAMKEAERAGRDRKEEEARKERERVEEDKRKKKEAEEEARQARIAASQPKPNAKKPQKQQASVPAASDAAPFAEVPEAPTAANQLETEIRAMMAKMRELNGKDPQLLARIWEEERKAKAPIDKSPTLTTKPAPQPAVVPPPKVHTLAVLNQVKRATPRASLSVPPVAPSAPAANPQDAPTAKPIRNPGKTIWPPEKKQGLAKAAVHYLNTKNPDRPVDSASILQMLDGNPSYVELCEELEQVGFKLDRSVFAKDLLTAVPDVNAASRNPAYRNANPLTALENPARPTVMKRPAPPAVMKNPIATPVAPSQRYGSASASPLNRPNYSIFPDNNTSATPPPMPIAEMILIKPELKLPANKEEAARKRNLSDLVDLTQLDDEEDMGPPMKKVNTNPMYTYGLPHPHIHDAMIVDAAPVNNFPTASTPAPVMHEPPPPMPTNELRYKTIVEPLDRKKALRRNTYNPATIARDVLLACGRHPSQRQLNQHLDILRFHLPQISYESDLSTLKWNLLDPGSPPPGYYKDSVRALAEDADGEDDSEGDEDEDRAARRGSSAHAESARVQALPVATNPFMKQKRRGRPPRQSLPNTTELSTPNRPNSVANMSASAPRPASAAASVGYAAFRSATEYGPDGKPLPKKKGRPVGWRKAVHGSAAAQQRSALVGQSGKSKTQQPSGLRNTGASDEPIRIDSRSPSVANRVPRYQSYKCKWQNCKAELHNLETLKLHVLKVHKKVTLRNTFECLWNDCGKEVTSYDAMSNTAIERHAPHAFASEGAWSEHIQQNHFDPLAWERGDGPAGGLSDARDSEAYLSDAQGRRVTPRITASSADYNGATPLQHSASVPRGRGRPAMKTHEQDARETQDRLVSQKRRMGGPGMDRGGATLVNEKRRRGLVETDSTEEELVDAED